MKPIRSFLKLAAVLAPLACVLGVAAGPAVAAEPSGEYAVFKECPLNNPAVSRCVYSLTKGGEVKIGSTAVPIKNPITLQGGVIVNEETGAETFVNAANGETLSKTPQPVPGGLLGLVKCNEISNTLERIACEVVFQNKVTGVNATTELVGPVQISATALAVEEGTALELPVRIHLENPFLGSGCYIGSASNPVTLSLTSGTTSPPPPNTPISGSHGTLEFRNGGELIVITGYSLVNNSFSVPKAEGCGGIFSFLIDPIIDSKLGLPSAAGHNTAILNGNLELASREGVEGSEK